jgi:hypothetical protein
MKLIDLIGNDIVFGKNWSETILIKKVPNHIFEIRFKYNSSVKIHQIPYSLYSCSPKGSITYIDEDSVNFMFEKDYHYSQTYSINKKAYKIIETNMLTMVLDMRHEQDTLYLKINSTLFPYVMCNIHSQDRLLKLESKEDETLTLACLSCLKTLPINTPKKCIYLNSYDGKHFIKNY